MDIVIKELEVFVFIDGILIPSSSEEENKILKETYINI